MAKAMHGNAMEMLGHQRSFGGRLYEAHSDVGVGSAAELRQSAALMGLRDDNAETYTNPGSGLRLNVLEGPGSEIDCTNPFELRGAEAAGAVPYPHLSRDQNGQLWANHMPDRGGDGRLIRQPSTGGVTIWGAHHADSLEGSSHDGEATMFVDSMSEESSAGSMGDFVVDDGRTARQAIAANRETTVYTDAKGNIHDELGAEAAAASEEDLHKRGAAAVAEFEALIDSGLGSLKLVNGVEVPVANGALGKMKLVDGVEVLDMDRAAQGRANAQQLASLVDGALGAQGKRAEPQFKRCVVVAAPRH